MYNYELSSLEKTDHRVRLYKKECRNQKKVLLIREESYYNQGRTNQGRVIWKAGKSIR